MKQRKYVSYDICFCDAKCNWKARCERHIANVPTGMVVCVSNLEGSPVCKKENWGIGCNDTKREYNRVKQRESRERRKRKDECNGC